MDPGTTVLLITVGTAAVGAIVTFIKLFRGRNAWQDEILKLRQAIDNHAQQNRLEFQRVENKINLLELDSEKIEEVKRYIDRVEDSIDRETSKLEQKIDDHEGHYTESKEMIMSAATAKQKEQVSASAKDLEQKITTTTTKLDKKLEQLKILLNFSKDRIFKQ